VAYNCFLNDDHFERHIGFLGKLQRDSPGLLVCYSTHISGATLVISACFELFQAYTTNVFVEMTAILDAILDFLESSRGDSPGLLVCCSTDFSGFILKI